LRLREARQLMLNENLESASQFSREYRRLFGAPPQRDVTRMRLNVNVVTTRTSHAAASA